MVSLNTLGKLVVIFCVVHLSRCRNELNVTRCPDPDVNTVEWKQYDKACHDKNPTYKFHCQQDNTGHVTIHRSYCAVPKTCFPGRYPFINGNAVECRECANGTYQPNGKISYEYKHPSCDENWSKPNPGEIECRSGSTTEDRRFKCNWMDSYIPDSTQCLCFIHDDVCSCYKKICQDGKELIENYTCVPSTNTSMKPPTTSDKTPDWVMPVAIVVPIAIAIVIAVVIVLCVRRRKQLKRKKRPRDTPKPNVNEDDNREPLMSKEQERTQIKGNSPKQISLTCCVFCLHRDEGQVLNLEDKSDKSQDGRKTEINAHNVGSMATGDNHSGNQTTTMPAETHGGDKTATTPTGSEYDSSKETSPS